MGKKVMFIISVLCIVFAYLYFVTFDFVYTLYPTKSASQKLTLVCYTGFHFNKPLITLSHYVGDQHACDYILAFERGLGEQDPQKHQLPELTEGSVIVSIELGHDPANGNFTIEYDSARDFCKNGLLIYLTTNESVFELVEGKNIYNRYVYFVSGKGSICYFSDMHSSEWEIIENPPALKIIPKIYNDGAPFTVWYSGWKEYEWIVVPAE